MASRLLWNSSRRYLLRHPVLIGLSILGVALGVAVVVAIDLANSSANRAFELSAATATGRATHQIIGARDDLDEDIYRQIRTDFGFRRAAPVIEGFASISGHPGTTLQVLGVDPLAETPFRDFTGGPGSDLDLGQFLADAGTGLIARSTAEALGLSPGDSATLSIGGIDRPIRIIGLMDPRDEQSERALENLLVVDIATGQELFGLQGQLSRIDLIVEDDEPGESQLARLKSFLPPEAEITRSVSRSETVEQMTRAFRLNLTALSLLALVVGMFLIYNTLTFSVVQRRSIIGRLRSLGVTKSEIFSLVLIEALVVGVVGTILGLLAGIVLGQGLVSLVTQTINDLYYVLRVQTVDLSTWTFAKGLALGIGATVLATIPPAREATSAPATTVLRRSEEESELRSRLPRLTALGLGFAAGAVILLILPGRSIVISYIALLCAILAFALFTPTIVTLVASVARPVLGSVGGIVGRMAARGVVSTLSRTGVAIASLMIAISATVGVGVMIDSFRSTVEVWLNYTLQADIYVSPPSLVFRRSDSSIKPDVEQIVRNAGGIDGAFSVRSARVTTSEGRVDLVVIDPAPEAQESFRFKKGSPNSVWATFSGGDFVIVSEPYSYKYDVAVDDTVTIETDHGPRRFPVRAVFYDYGSDLGVVMMSRATYDRHFDDPFVSGLALYASPGQDVDQVISNLRARIGDRQELLIRSNRTLRDASLEVFDRTFTVTIVLRLLAVLVAFVGVLSALMALQLERARELAVLRANGLTPRQVWRFVTMQTGLMGFISGILAIPLGLVLAYGLIFVINRRSFGWTLQIEISPWILVQAVILAIIAALLAGLYPSWKMAKANPATALREE